MFDTWTILAVLAAVYIPSFVVVGVCYYNAKPYPYDREKDFYDDYDH
jgi:hypothetical protein